MPTANGLLNTEIGAEKQILKALKRIDRVEEPDNRGGIYNIIANIKANSVKKFKFIINSSIEIGKINSKLTMIINEQAPRAIKEHLVSKSVLLIQTV